MLFVLLLSLDGVIWWQDRITAELLEQHWRHNLLEKEDGIMPMWEIKLSANKYIYAPQKEAFCVNSPTKKSMRGLVCQENKNCFVKYV